MSRRTKLKVRNLQLFLTKQVFNSRYIVRNILAVTVMITFVAVIAGGVMVMGDKKSDKAEQPAVTGSVEAVQTIDGSIVLMDASGTSVIRADLEANLKAGKEAKEKEIVAAAANEFANKCVANRDEVNVRAEASTESAIVGRMNIGACGDIVSQKDGWVELTSGDVKGYVKAEYLTIGEEAYALAQQYYSATAVVTEDGVCLRAAASKDSEVIGAVYENVTYLVTTDKTTEDWVCIQVSSSGEGYVSADYIDVTEGYRVAQACETEAEETSETENTTEESKKASDGSVEEVQNKKPQNTTETTTQAPTEATTQAPPEANIGMTSRTPIALSDADINLMAAVMTLECGGESYEGQLAVANVILNRLQMGNWGSTISDVVYAPYQFSVVSDPRMQTLIENGAQASCIQAARDACAGNNNIGDLIGFRPTWNMVDLNSVAAYKQIGNHIFFKY